MEDGNGKVPHKGAEETEEGDSPPGESPGERISVRKKRTIPVPEAARSTLATRRPPPPPPTSQTIRPQSPSSQQLQPQSPSSPTFTSSTLPRPSRPAPVRVPHPASSPSLLSTSPVSVSPSLLSVSPSHVSSLPCTPPHSPRIGQIPLTTTTTTTITPAGSTTTTVTPTATTTTTTRPLPPPVPPHSIKPVLSPRPSSTPSGHSTPTATISPHKTAPPMTTTPIITTTTTTTTTPTATVTIVTTTTTTPTTPHTTTTTTHNKSKSTGDLGGVLKKRPSLMSLKKLKTSKGKEKHLRTPSSPSSSSSSRDRSSSLSNSSSSNPNSLTRDDVIEVLGNEEHRRDICKEGLECTSTDPDHFMQFQHTPPKEPKENEKDKEKENNDKEKGKEKEVGGIKEIKDSLEGLALSLNEAGNSVIRKVCPQGMGCQDSDPQHFLEFQHTPSESLILTVMDVLQEKRSHVVNEILKTERTYLQCLKILVEDYQLPLEIQAQEKKPFITHEQIKCIFYQLRVIIGFNSVLLTELEERITVTWSGNSQVGDIFTRMADHFRIYGNYLDNYPNAMGIIKQLRENKKFVAFLEAVTERHKGGKFAGHQIETFLITPVQRIPRYTCLLESLLECTPKEHTDYPLIEQAIKKIQQVAVDNERLQEASANTAVLFRIQKRFLPQTLISPIVEPMRKFIHQGRVEVQEFPGKALNDSQRKKSSPRPTVTPSLNVAKDRYLLLFSDIIIIAREGEKKEKERERHTDKEREKEEKEEDTGDGPALYYVFQLELLGCKVEDLEDEYDFISTKETIKNALKLIHSVFTLRLSFHTEHEKKKWLYELRNSIANRKQAKKLKEQAG